MSENGIESPAATEAKIESGELSIHTRAGLLMDMIPPNDWPMDATILRGEQHEAHVALQAATKALKDANAAVGEAQAAFRGALERWCKASEQP